MMQTHTQTLAIRRPVRDVYDFVSDPANMSKWSMVDDVRHEPTLGAHVWSFTGPAGRMEAHVVAREASYIVDYEIRQDGQTTHVAHMRFMPNGNGTVLTHIYVQQPMISDEIFASDVEWMATDLQTLRSILEI